MTGDIQILLVEDDPAITSSLKAFLGEEGYEVDCADTQILALTLIKNNHYNMVLLDVSLREGNGFAVCAESKEKIDSSVPVIFLTASGDEGSVVEGLDIGADDYIAKPFRPRELLSRIRRCLRNSGGASHNVVTLARVTVNLDSCRVSKDGTDIELSALEYRILLMFINNRGILMSRTKLLDEIWDIAGDYVNDNTLTVYIKRLREKIEDDPANPQIIKTVRGLGYRVD